MHRPVLDVGQQRDNHDPYRLRADEEEQHHAWEAVAIGVHPGRLGGNGQGSAGMRSPTLSGIIPPSKHGERFGGDKNARWDALQSAYDTWFNSRTI